MSQKNVLHSEDPSKVYYNAYLQISFFGKQIKDKAILPGTADPLIFLKLVNSALARAACF